MKNTINIIVIHCSATRETQDYSFEQLEADHKKRGFRECGYNYYIKRNGEVFEGRPIGATLAHAKGHNKNAIAICYEGGLDANGKPKDTRTKKQKQALMNLVLGFKTIYQKAKILGHRDLSPDLNNDGKITPNEYMKQCPCFNVQEMYE